MAGKSSLKTGEKVLFGVFGIFLVLAVLSYAILEAVRLTSDRPLFETKTRYEMTDEGLRGSALFRTSRCTSCHRAMRNGTNMGLSLDGLGSKRTYEQIISFLKEPEANYAMRTLDHGPAPKEAAYVAEIAEDELLAIARFLSGLKSDQGSASSPTPPEGRSQFIDSMIKVWAPKEWDEKYEDIRDKTTKKEEL